MKVWIRPAEGALAPETPAVQQNKGTSGMWFYCNNMKNSVSVVPIIHEHKMDPLDFNFVPLLWHIISQVNKVIYRKLIKVIFSSMKIGGFTVGHWLKS